jgi:hypothetical protein
MSVIVALAWAVMERQSDGIRLDVVALERVRVAGAAVEATIAWVAWRDGLERAAPAGGDAWRDDHLEHTFTLGVQPPAGDGTPFALSARAWTGDRLDWHCCVRCDRG